MSRAIHRTSAALLIGAMLVGASLLAACSRESSPLAGPDPGVYKGPADQHPWDDTATPWSPSRWKTGDRASWEAALRQRGQGQNEYVRTK